MNLIMQNDLGSYKHFLERLLEKDYKFINFPEATGEAGQIIMRHDIDFDTGMALQSAEIEAELGIKATYFFLLRSHFYNVFSSKDHNNIERIKALGHTISIHFDPTEYEDFADGLSKEIKVFNTLFDEHINIISLHRPNEFFLQYNEPIFGVEHTYQDKYFKNIKYFADSTGKWRFGNPFDSEEFNSRKPLHILIHPIWWFIDEANNHEKLKSFYKKCVQQLKEEFSQNCIPFRDIQHEV